MKIASHFSYGRRVVSCFFSSCRRHRRRHRCTSRRLRWMSSDVEQSSVGSSAKLTVWIIRLLFIHSFIHSLIRETLFHSIWFRLLLNWEKLSSWKRKGNRRQHGRPCLFKDVDVVNLRFVVFSRERQVDWRRSASSAHRVSIDDVFNTQDDIIISSNHTSR